MSTSAICMSTADASSGCAIFSCLSSTISRVSARGGRGGRSVTGDCSGPSPFLPCLEHQPESESREARADPKVRVAEGRPGPFDHTLPVPDIDHALVVEVEDVQEDAGLPSARSKRERLL